MKSKRFRDPSNQGTGSIRFRGTGAHPYRNIMVQLKDDLVKSVERNIEMIECSLHVALKENESLIGNVNKKLAKTTGEHANLET